MLAKHLVDDFENSLTAAIFSHLFHLPSELFWQIIRDACFTQTLPSFSGEPLEIHPWPQWDATGTTNSSYVIPDMFVRFEAFDLIIEAKRWDTGQQNNSQWHKEFTAYLNEHGAANRSVRMIALGGIFTQEDDDVEINSVRYSIHMCQWRRLLEQCQRAHKELLTLKFPTSHSAACGRILEHIIGLFGYFGYATGQWYSDFDFDKHRLSSYATEHSHVFYSRSRELSRK